MIRPLGKWLIGLVVAVLVLIGGAMLGADWIGGRIERATNPAPETIVSASLQGLRAQNRLSSFVASYVAVVTSTQRRFGLEARKTLIMPGLVRYEVDMARLRPQDVTWDAASATLSVVLPPVDLVGPQVDLTRIREYDGGGLLLRLTDARSALDQSNRQAGQAELLRQARAPVPMGLARDATRRAVESSFALPLRATGLNATVRVRFPDEPGFPAIEAVDGSRRLDAVYGNEAER